MLGIQQGYKGLDPHEGLEPVELTADGVDDINDMGGTVLGTSRGSRDPVDMVDYLEQHDIDILFCIGGDGTQRGAHAIAEEGASAWRGTRHRGHPQDHRQRRALRVPVVRLCHRPGGGRAASCGGRTSRPRATPTASVWSSSWAAMPASSPPVPRSAAQEANFVLVPEVPFPLEGEGGFLDALEQRIDGAPPRGRGPAEGAGQHLFESGDASTDASGNRRYRDIGLFLRDRIRGHFGEREIETTVKYFDPSYSIRSVPPNANDRFLTDRLARNAVHAAMAGKTDVMVGAWNQATIWVPIATAVAERKRMDLDGDLWNAVLATTGQPNWRPSGLPRSDSRQGRGVYATSSGWSW